MEVTLPSMLMPTASVERYNAPVSMTFSRAMRSRHIFIIVELKAVTYRRRSSSGVKVAIGRGCIVNR